MVMEVNSERIKSLPKWAQKHIDDLEARVKTAEATIPWTETGMEWFTLLSNTPTNEKIFLLSKSGAHCIATIGPNDRVFVGRGKCAPQRVLNNA